MNRTGVRIKSESLSGLRRNTHYGVKIDELKRIQKRIKVNYRLALELYDTGVYDAMYLAGLIADDAKMTKKDLQHWVDKASAPLARSTVAWVAAQAQSGSPHAVEMALKWIDSPKDLVAAAGWSTLGSLVAIKPDADLRSRAAERTFASRSKVYSLGSRHRPTPDEQLRHRSRHLRPTLD